MSVLGSCVSSDPYDFVTQSVCCLQNVIWLQNSTPISRLCRRSINVEDSIGYKNPWVKRYHICRYRIYCTLNLSDLQMYSHCRIKSGQNKVIGRQASIAGFKLVNCRRTALILRPDLTSKSPQQQTSLLYYLPSH